MKASLAQRGKNGWRAFRAATDGATAIEYAIIAAGIAGVIIAVVMQIGPPLVVILSRVLPGLA